MKPLRTVVFALVLAAPLMAAACNTVEGFGKDVSKAGDQLEESADEAKN
jgi:entericidin A